MTGAQRERLIDEYYYATLAFIQCGVMLFLTCLAVMMEDPMMTLPNPVFAYMALNMALPTKRTRL
ncbi:MAG: hypothetical protein EOP83_09600 [Verrucomicrobiaceae bacterium]|nr:MAG: hypothetical protein EOP83_09600 [Verrucomicrobiaceae bacterium]